jgi:hypothetical protein
MMNGLVAVHMRDSRPAGVHRHDHSCTPGNIYEGPHSPYSLTIPCSLNACASNSVNMNQSFDHNRCWGQEHGHTVVVGLWLEEHGRGLFRVPTCRSRLYPGHRTRPSLGSGTCSTDVVESRYPKSIIFRTNRMCETTDTGCKYRLDVHKNKDICTVYNTKDLQCHTMSVGRFRDPQHS